MSDSRNPFYTEDKNPFSLGGGGGRNPFETGQDRQAGSFGSYNPGGGYGYEGRSTVQQQVQASAAAGQLETQQAAALQSMYQQREHGRRGARWLNRTEEKLDQHRGRRRRNRRADINSLSSMFGGVKNWFRGDSAKKRQAATQQYEPERQPAWTRPWPSAPPPRPGDPRLPR
uniref:Uncharacterized protein n=1 Tax=Macrostomum lignano TaxID=282301 RepID=A0A1I8F857_9PLAT